MNYDWNRIILQHFYFFGKKKKGGELLLVSSILEFLFQERSANQRTIFLREAYKTKRKCINIV